MISIKSRAALDNMVALTTPVRLRDGRSGYIVARCWNARQQRHEYDVRLDGNDNLRGLTAEEFDITGEPRRDILRSA